MSPEKKASQHVWIPYLKDWYLACLLLESGYPVRYVQTKPNALSQLSNTRYDSRIEYPIASFKAEFHHAWQTIRKCYDISVAEKCLQGGAITQFIKKR